MAKTRSQKKKKSTTWWFIGLTLVLVSVLGFLMMNKEEVITVEIEKVERYTIMSSVSESGVVQPAIEVKIAPDVSGEIVELYFKEGDKVKKGDLLVTIQPENYRSALEQAQASVNTSKANYLSSKADLGQAHAKYMQDSANFKRTDGLYKEKVVSKMEWENSKLQADVSYSQYASSKQRVEANYFGMKSSEASLKQARQNLDRTNIYATMDGTVTLVNVEKGERVVGTIQMAGTEIMRIADLTTMEVKVEINENDIINLQIGDSASIEVDAYEDKEFKGIVSEIAYSASVQALGSTDQITNFEVKVVIKRSSYVNDPDVMRGLPKDISPFRPGMSAQVDIYTDMEADVIAVPIQAVTLRKPKRGQSEEEAEEEAEIQEIVYTLTEGIISEVEVSTGISDDKYIKIESGLNGGEWVVIGPYLVITKKMKDGVEAEKVQDKSNKKRSSDEESAAGESETPKGK